MAAAFFCRNFRPGFAAREWGVAEGNLHSLALVRCEMAGEMGVLGLRSPQRG